MILENKNSYEVLTPTGFRDFLGIQKITKKEYLRIKLENDIELKCSPNHRFVVEGGEVFAEHLKEGDFLEDETFNHIAVSTVERITDEISLYDILDVANGNIFLANGIVSHNCDADFLASGDTVFLQADLDFFTDHYVEDPIQRRGVDGNLWIWKEADFTRDYALISDVARGDGEDYSTFHVMDIETNEQVAEYKGQLGPVDLGNLIVAVATEYNDALAVVENANIGWATLEQLINRNYKNIYYSAKNPLETVETYMQKYENDKLVPGFTNSVRTRPLMFTKLEEYVRDRAITIKSKRTIQEMEVFVWKNGKMQAQKGYNDDLVLPLSIYTFIRDTALRYAKQGQDAARNQISAFTQYNKRSNNAVTDIGKVHPDNPYKLKTNHGDEDVTWLFT